VKGRELSGYEANIPYMAAKVGQYRGLSDTIGGIADSFSSCAAGDLGPGGIAAALQTVADNWRDGLSSMADRIGNMAHGLSEVTSNYQAMEDSARRTFTNPYIYGGPH
jgi:hypothetical protein